MVKAVRSGNSLRAVAGRFEVSPATVSLWVKRSAGRRLDRCEWTDRKAGPRRPWNRTPANLEQRVLEVRRQLREDSVLGEFGAPAIQRALIERERSPTPSVASISRILVRHGAIDARRRVRRPAPPRGWYLPQAASGQLELDSFDIIEDLKLQNGPLICVLTAISLHGSQVAAWPEPGLRAKDVLERLLAHWRSIGLPGYAQFDNDTRFQGAHQFPDTIGRVSRLCLSLGIIPVFAPPREPGFQNAIESFNGLWQAKVWQRFHYADLAALQVQSQRYVQAHHQRTGVRREAAPARQAVSDTWHLDLNQALLGTLIYLRRTDAQGSIVLLGHRWCVNREWVHRLVRCEIQLGKRRILCYALRRREPTDQPLLAEIPYHHPQKPFQGES